MIRVESTTMVQPSTHSDNKTGTDCIGMSWEGLLVVGSSPLPAGYVSFGTRSDDGSVVWVDVNKDGKFGADDR